MTSQKKYKEESSSPGCAGTIALVVLAFFLLGFGMFLVGSIQSLLRGETFDFICMSSISLVLAGVIIFAGYRVGKNVLVKYTLEADPQTGVTVITEKLFGKTLSVKTGSPPQKVELNLEAPRIHYPPSFICLHYATMTGLSRSGGMKWYRYLASLMEGPLAALGALQVFDFYQVVFKEQTSRGKSETTFEFFVRPGPRGAVKINAMLERQMIDIVYDWDEKELPQGMPLYGLVQELFTRHYFNTPTRMLRKIMQDAQEQGLGDAKRLGSLWETSPEHATAFNDDSRKFKQFMERLQARHPQLTAALKEKTFQAIPKHDEA